MFGNDYDTVDGTGDFGGGWGWGGVGVAAPEIQAVINPRLFPDHINKAGIPLLGVRDYIHVVDLAKGHIAALKKLKENCGCKVRQ